MASFAFLIQGSSEISSLSWLWRVKVPPRVIAFGLLALRAVFSRWITVVDGE